MVMFYKMVGLELVVSFAGFSTSDHVGHFLGYHDDRCVSVAGCHGRHHGRIDHAQSLHEVNPASTAISIMVNRNTNHSRHHTLCYVPAFINVYLP